MWSTHKGFCGATQDGEPNDCARDALGSFGPLLPHELANWSVAWAVCSQRCLQCARCRFVTVSLKYADCSWYAKCDLGALQRTPSGFRSRRVRATKLPALPPDGPLFEPPAPERDGPPSCSIYVHDPGAQYNTVPMSLPTQRWSDTDHNWHIAYWLHRALHNYAHRTTNPQEADVIYLAHYFLTDNPRGRPLDFGSPLLGWDADLKRGGASQLLNGSAALLERWARRPADFVAAPILLACFAARGFLHAARWIITEPFFQNSCGYRYHFDVVAPQVVSSDVWRPASIAASAHWPKSRFLTYVGRLGKPYVDAPMSTLRFRMWASLRAHPNVTFLATDYDTAVAPYLQDPARPCRACSYSCKRCLDPSLGEPPVGEQPGLGLLPRANSKAAYLRWLTGSTFCLVLRGDNENTRKFTEVILAGCIPVLIADMPAWPFDRWLDYRSFSYEFDLEQGMASPRLVVERLLRLPPEEIAAKRAQLLRVRERFFWHADPSVEGATQRLIADMCAKPKGRPVGGHAPPLRPVYRARPKEGL